MRGQLMPDERKFLYNSIIETRPSLVLEIGTWGGGGSTYQIASALRRNGVGRLVTCEIDAGLYNEAVMIYDDWDEVECRNVDSTTYIKELIDSRVIPDFLFFDGAEDPGLNLNDLLLLEPHLIKYSHFCAHDWDLGVRINGGVSVKSELLRPYIEGSSKWSIIRSLTSPVSVGIVLARYLG